MFGETNDGNLCTFCTQEMLENLKGSYDDERIATMAVSIDIKKELEAKLYPTYADRLPLRNRLQLRN